MIYTILLQDIFILGTFSRLGPKKTESQKKLQVSPGVFGRLGKQVSSSS